MPPNLTPRADSVPYALLARLRARGVATATVTLHVGPGTFLPVTTDDVDAHPMDAEAYDVPAATAAAIVATRRAGQGETTSFVRPGFRFRVVDELSTNFHLPKSTLLMLVAAFAGLPWTRAAYTHAVAAGCRFYSYADASLFL